MEFREPRTIEEAVAILAADEDARCLAGGATLVAMMNARLVEPSILVSLRQIGELKGLGKAADGAVSIGAMTTHAAIAASTELAGGQSVLREAAGVVGHPAIRNMGTLGGSISHGDAAADYPAALVAASAAVSVAGPAGARDVAAGDFFVDFLETALEPGEMVVRVALPAGPAGAVGVYEKFARVDGDFATVSVAAVLAMSAGACSHAAVALGGCGPVPVRSAAAEELLVGSSLSADDVSEACKPLIEACDPLDDFRGSPEYRLQLVPVMVGRAIERAKRKAERM